MAEDLAGRTKAPHDSGDARDWAQFWLATLADHPGIATDEGTMIGWFANAMQAALDARPQYVKDREMPPDQDFVILPRDSLFQFLGEMALPPWTDERGRQIGERIDCAPIASRLSEWVDEHDLSDLYLQPAKAGTS